MTKLGLKACKSDAPPKAQSLERHILVVDDNPAILRLLGTLFADEGMTVNLASSAKAAREALMAQPDSFDLVLSDISMPGESGFDLLQWIKRPDSPFAELPVLLTTAQLPEAENRLKGLALGAVDYVVRPIELRELVLRAIKAIEHFQQVKNLELMLQDAGNLATVGRLLAASSHEIKNLASLVTLCSERLAQVLNKPQYAALIDSDSRFNKLLTTLCESSSLLTDVARNASSLLDPQPEPPRPVHIGNLMDSVTSLMQTRVQPCRLASKPGVIWGLGHVNRLKQVLINLILNAAEAIAELDPPEGGTITLAVTHHGETLHLTVTDNGIGLSTPGERTEFTAFQTTKKLRGGQGLGLWLCSRLCEAMGGKLSLSSAGVGKGATACITLRVGQPPPTDYLDLSQYFID
jgi:signal transduction histidine kinase